MLTKNYFLIFACLLVAGGLFAQQPSNGITPNFCGTTHYSPWLTWYHDHKAELAQQRSDDTTWLYVPVTIHLTAPDNATNFYDETQAFRIICELNEQYAPARIYYYLMPGDAFRYHANTSWYIHDWEGGAEMIETTRIPDRLNCYIVDDPAGNCGYSWLDAIVMGTGCSGPGNSTWAHEAGHHFSLPHTFFGWEGHSWNFTQPAPTDWDDYPVEKMDGSNCYDAGDRFCDTKPDYLNYRWGCDNQQKSTVIQLDPNGVEFKSDATLFMSYALDACASRFSEEQIEAMRTNLFTEHSSYLQVSDFGGLVDDNAPLSYIAPIDSSIEQYNNVTLQWEAVPNATFYQVQVSTSPYFSLLFANTFVYNTTSVTITKNLPNNRTLYWRIIPYSEWDLCKNPNTPTYAIFKTKNLSATNDLETVADISLTPNPVSGGQPAVLQVNSSEGMDILFTVHDAAGRLCYQKQSEMFAGDNQILMATNDMEPGIYFIGIQTKYGFLVKRLVITE